MLQENLLKIYETSFRENREMSALTDYFKGETFSYYEMAKEIAKLHLLFKKAGIKQGDKIALIGRNNPRWCITYMGTITYGAVIVPILQDFTPADIIHIINHSESRLLFLGDNFWDVIEEDQIKQIEAVFSLTDFHAIYERDGKSLTKFQRDIVKNYRTKYPRGFSVNDIKYPEIPNDQVVLLNYTSGTTGYSKGVMLTVNNLTGNVMFAATTINTQTGQRLLPERRPHAVVPAAGPRLRLRVRLPRAAGRRRTHHPAGQDSGGEDPAGSDGRRETHDHLLRADDPRKGLPQAGAPDAGKRPHVDRHEDSAAQLGHLLGDPQETDGRLRRQRRTSSSSAARR